MISLRKIVPLTVIGAAILSASFAFADKADQPLNAGKDGIKSNAGVGNGTEDQVGDTTVTEEVIISYSTYDRVTTSGPVVLSQTTSSVETGRVLVSYKLIGCGAGNQVCNKQSTYSVTYDVYTTTVSATTTTTETILVTETQIKTTYVTDMYDIDPGRSQDVNQAPEGEPEDIVVIEYSDPVITESVEGEPSVVTTTSTRTSVTGTSTGTVKVTTPCNNAQCT